MAESSTGKVGIGVLELVHRELEVRLGLEDPADGGEPLGEQAPESFLILAHDLENEVEPARTRAQVLDLGESLKRLDDAGVCPWPDAQEDDGKDLVADPVRIGHRDDAQRALPQ